MNTRSIIIRPYRQEDLDATIEIFLRAIRDTASADYSSLQVDAWAQADRRTWAERRLRQATWLAFLDSEPAGFAELAAAGHIDMLFVSPSFGGRGVASALLRTVEGVALGQGARRLTTDASITARPFFEACGFQVVAVQSVVRRGQRLTNFRMEKFIGASDH